ncbi:uncharacterized protein LOC132614425 [Lycium barbarum]|uniref:uncharacterized protein LOC132614425 n=1 Tax=Lycium barbarum TaxID=112863 RepID=UPI00293F413A|nr:uncharacterized protein LOC132614425 [Lycium barbarum]
MSWINHVLDSHKGGFTLEEFSVSFPFDTSFKCEIDKWIKFASSKKVKSLKIDFSVNCREGILYTFPPSVLSGFEALKVLALNWVDVDNQVATKRCKNSVGPSLKLKHLEICYCPIYSLEIRNVNLGSFTFKGWEITNLLLENVTSVHNVDIKGTMCESESQLGVPLVLAPFDDSFPKFDNLKVLSLRLTNVSTAFLFKVTPLLELSPYLQKFTIEAASRGQSNEFTLFEN